MPAINESIILYFPICETTWLLNYGNVFLYGCKSLSLALCKNKGGGGERKEKKRKTVGTGEQIAKESFYT